MPRALRIVTDWKTLPKASVRSHRIPQLPADVVHLADVGRRRCSGPFLEASAPPADARPSHTDLIPAMYVLVFVPRIAMRQTGPWRIMRPLRVGRSRGPSRGLSRGQSRLPGGGACRTSDPSGGQAQSTTALWRRSSRRRSPVLGERAAHSGANRGPHPDKGAVRGAVRTDFGSVTPIFAVEEMVCVPPSWPEVSWWLRVESWPGLEGSLSARRLAWPIRRRIAHCAYEHVNWPESGVRQWLGTLWLMAYLTTGTYSTCRRIPISR